RPQSRSFPNAACRRAGGGSWRGPFAAVEEGNSRQRYLTPRVSVGQSVEFSSLHHADLPSDIAPMAPSPAGEILRVSRALVGGAAHAALRGWVCRGCPVSSWSSVAVPAGPRSNFDALYGANSGTPRSSRTRNAAPAARLRTRKARTPRR